MHLVSAYTPEKPRWECGTALTWQHSYYGRNSSICIKPAARSTCDDYTWVVQEWSPVHVTSKWGDCFLAKRRRTFCTRTTYTRMNAIVFLWGKPEYLYTNKRITYERQCKNQLRRCLLKYFYFTLRYSTKTVWTFLASRCTILNAG